MVRCAIVEFNDYHDEVIPTLVYMLNRLRIEPDVYLTQHAQAKAALSCAGDLRYRLMVIDGGMGIPRLRGTPSRVNRYDLLVLNSVEPAEVTRRAAALRGPTIAVLHNPHRRHDDPATRAYLASLERVPVALGPNVRATRSDEGGLSWVAPVFFGDPPQDSWAQRDSLTVQGYVEFARRDYVGLLAAVPELVEEFPDLMIDIVGRSDTRDGERLRNMIERGGLGSHFRFTGREVGFPEFFRRFAAAGFCLPLLDPDDPYQAAYLDQKISSSMSLSTGLGVIPIADERVVHSYGLDGVAVSHGAGDVAGGIRLALALSDEETRVRRRKLGEIRSALLERSVANTARILGDFGLIEQGSVAAMSRLTEPGAADPLSET